MIKQPGQPLDADLHTSITEVKKDLEYLIQHFKEQKSEIETLKEDMEIFKQFLYKWKGGALVLIGLGGAVTWLLNSIVKVLPMIGK